MPRLTSPTVARKQQRPGNLPITKLLEAYLLSRSEILDLREQIGAAAAAERERIAARIDDEADICPCAEDAKVLRETAQLVRDDFSYEEADQCQE